MGPAHRQAGNSLRPTAARCETRGAHGSGWLPHSRDSSSTSDWPAAAGHAIHPVTPRSGLGRPRRCRTWPPMARPWAAEVSPLSTSAQASPAACSFVTSTHHLLRRHPERAGVHGRHGEQRGGQTAGVVSYRSSLPPDYQLFETYLCAPLRAHSPDLHPLPTAFSSILAFWWCLFFAS